MEDNFTRALARDLVYEGGYVNNPKDPGGATNKGITQATYNSWLERTNRPQAAVSKISDEDVAAIYKTDYWDRIYGDELPSGIDFCVFDAAVNSGVATAVSWAQAVLKTYDNNKNLAIDGDLGPATKTAIQKVDEPTFIRDFCSHRLGTLKRLKTWSTFGKGWAARIANVQKTAIAWAESGDAEEGPEPVIVKAPRAPIEAVPVSRWRSISAHVSTGVAAAGAGIASLSEGLQPASGTFPWVATVLSVLAILGAVIGVIVMVMRNRDDAAANSIAKVPVDADADAGLPVVRVGKSVTDRANVTPTPGPAAVVSVAKPVVVPVPVVVPNPATAAVVANAGVILPEADATIVKHSV